MIVVDVRELGIPQNANPFAKGAVGELYRPTTPVASLPGRTLVFKKIKLQKDLPPGLDRKRALAQTRSVVAMRDSLSPGELAELDEVSVWPLAMVRERGKDIGILLDLIAPEFFVDTKPAGGPVGRALFELQFLCVSAGYFQKTGIDPAVTGDGVMRLALSARLANAIEIVHRRPIVFGDLHLKNAVAAVKPFARVLLMDCDSAAELSDNGRVQLHGPGFAPPEIQTKQQKLQDQKTDVYKLGLCVIKALSPGKGATQATDPTRTAAGLLDSAGIDLLRRAVGVDRAQRPTAAQLRDYLVARVSSLVTLPELLSAELSHRVALRGSDVFVRWDQRHGTEVRVFGANGFTIDGIDPGEYATGYAIQLVRDRIESDPALYDLVTVADGPSPAEFPEPSDWDRALLSRLVTAAMPQRHFLAPSAVLAVVVVGEHERDIQRVGLDLRGWSALERLHVVLYQCGVTADRERGGVAADSVLAVAAAASRIIEMYEQEPATAIGEAEFLTEVAALLERQLIRSEDPPPEQRRRAIVGASGSTDVVVARAPAAPARTEPARAEPARAEPARAEPARTEPARFASPPPPPERVLRPPVFHHGDDTVVLDNRSALGRLRTPAPTDAESVDRLARVTDAVSLAFFVFVPDEEAGSRRLNRGHRPMALKLDQVLATVVGDAATGRPMRVAVEVFTAGTPLAKHGVLRPAGELTEDDLPKLRTAFFDHAKTVASLRSTANRTIQAFRARHVEVLSLHFIFLSSTRLFDANTFGADWDSLLRGARATWAEIGPTRAADGVDPFRQAPDISASPYGFHLVSDRYDVVAMIREESGLLYVYDSAPVAQTAPALTSHDLASDSPAPEPTAGGDHETTKQKSRLRWPRRRPTGTAT